MIYVLGGANMDIYGISRSTINLRDSNIGTVQTVHGGVARNVTESLARLGLPVKFMSAFGNDAFGKELMEHLESLNVDLSDSLVVDDEKTSTYLAVINDGDMYVAICDNQIIFKLTEKSIDSYLKQITKDDILVMDTNLSEEIISYVMNHVDARIFIDPLSIEKTEKIKDHLKNIYACKPNIYEAEAMVGKKIRTLEELCAAGDTLLAKGVRHVCISLGDKGMYYQNSDERYLVQITPQQMVNASGAGDACMAGIVYGSYHNMSSKDMIEYAMTNAVLALQSETTVNQQLNKELLKKKRNTLKFEWRKL